ncbi:GMC family oxidoreductase [Mycobacterium sp. C31M]
MERFDVIVVGGGSAGAGLAGRLSDDPDRSVLVLEAGPDFVRTEDFPLEIQRANVISAMAPGSPFVWPSVAQWTPASRMPMPRGKVIGGGSAVNGAYCVRGLASDFDRWAAAGNPSWSFDAVLPYFRESEADREFGADAVAHGSSGPIPITRAMPGEMAPISESFVRACLDHGFTEDLDKNALRTGDGIGPVPTNVRDGVRVNSALAYLTPRRGRPNLTVRGNSVVSRVVTEGQRAVGVEVVIDGKLRTIRSEEVILSAGAAKSPHLLMLSGIGPADQLVAHDITVVHDLPGVGQEFMDHTEVFIGFKPAAKSTAVPNNRGLVEAVLHTTAGNSAIASNVEIMPMILPQIDAFLGAAAGLSRVRSAVALASHPIGAVRALRKADLPSLVRFTSSVRSNVFIVSVLNQLSRGSMTLTSADPSVFPRFEHHLFSEPEDRRQMREAIRLTVSLMRSAAFRPMVKELSSEIIEALPSDRELDRWMIRNPAPSGHLMGTCRMGPASVPGTVVDEHCRVHGIDNLRVADLSVVPTLISRGPNATAMMMGNRAADLIASTAGVTA